MFKAAALAGIASATKGPLSFMKKSTNMAPNDFTWLDSCDFDKDYSRYGHFNKIAQLVENRDSCNVIGSHMQTIMDLNIDLVMDKCEHMYGCIGMGAEYEDCAHYIEDTTPENGLVTLADIVKVCDLQFPNNN